MIKLTELIKENKRKDLLMLSKMISRKPSDVAKFLKKYKAKVDKDFSVIVNLGPGSFSTVRTSLAVAKGIKISKVASL